MDTRCILPAELVRNVLCYTSIRDVVRWQAVSKCFCAITRDPVVWKALYLDAPFMRPDGPFPTASFQHGLIRSARLAQSWTKRHLRVLSRVKIPFQGDFKDGSRLIGGRWFIVCQSNRRFVLYDTNARAETRAPPRVLWEQEETIDDWDMCTGISKEGNSIVYVLVATEPESPRWTLLEFQLDADSGALRDTVSFDVPVSDPSSACVSLEDGKGLFSPSRFISFSDSSLFFDKQTRSFYKLPEFRLALDQVRSQVGNADIHSGRTIVVTNTHILVWRGYSPPGSAPWSRFPNDVIQAFTIPNDGCPVENGIKMLQLSHEAGFGSLQSPFVLARNSVVDPVTGSVNVRLLMQSKYDSFGDVQCLDVTLPFSMDVSPLILEEHSVIQKGNVPRYLQHAFPNDEFYDVSENGYARGVYTLERDNDKRPIIVKFTIDATQDDCVFTIGQATLGELSKALSSTAESDQDATLSLGYATLDGVRGRLCCCDNTEDGHVFVADLA